MKVCLFCIFKFGYDGQLGNNILMVVVYAGNKMMVVEAEKVGYSKDINNKVIIGGSGLIMVIRWWW